jgi:hypothetical protein
MALTNLRSWDWRRLLCACDALFPPIVVTLAFRAGHEYGAAQFHGVAAPRPGLLAITLAMILSGRAVFRLEEALRAPEGYRTDLWCLARIYLALLAMGVSIRLLG